MLMTTQEIETLLGVPNSTLSDWSNGNKRNSLAKLLRAIDIEAAKALIDTEDKKPKVSLKTQHIKLNKKLYKKDLLWSRENGSVISIKNLISIYLNTPNQEDIQTLVQQFGEHRVLHVLEKNRPFMNKNDYSEAKEQIEYFLSPEEYIQKHEQPTIEQLIQEPKQRYVEILMQQYSPQRILEMVKSYNITYPSLFRIQKMLGISA